MKKTILASILLVIGPALFGQASHFISKSAGRDSARAFQLLGQAQHNLDTLQFDQAYQVTLEAERLLRQHLDASDPWMIELYCLQGISQLFSSRPNMYALGDKVETMLADAPNPPSRANALFFVGTCYLSKRLLAPADSLFEKSLEIYLALPAPPSLNIGRIYSNMGLVAAYSGQVEKAITRYQQSIDFLTEHGGVNSPLLASPYNNRGLVYWELGLYDEALRDLSFALDIRKRLLPPGHPHIAANLNNLGLLAFQKGSLEQAHQYFLQSLAMFRQAKDTLNESQAIHNLGLVRDRQLEYADARRYYEQTLAIEQAQQPRNNDGIALTLFNIGVTWREEGRFDTAYHYFQKALELASPDHPQYAEMLNSVGLALDGMGLAEDALVYFEGAYREKAARYGEGHPLMAQICFNQANVAIKQGDWQAARGFNLAAQQKLGYKGDQDFSKVALLFDLSTVLAQYSRLQYQFAKNAADLEEALSAARDALLAYQQFSIANHQPMERQVARAAAFSSIELAIAVNQGLFEDTKDTAFWRSAFDFSERSKAGLLLEAMQEANALKNSRVEPALIQRERQLRQTLTQFDIQLQESQFGAFNLTDSALTEIALERATLLREYDSLMQQIIQSGEKRLSLETIPLKTLQDSLLQPGQTLLEYLVGERNIYVFVVQPHFFSVQEIPKDFPLERTVDTLLRLGINGYHTLPQTAQTTDKEDFATDCYTRAARLLYDKLVAPVRAHLSANLVIIPDGVLGYVPFEALLSKAPGRKGVFTSYPYLLNDFSISYCYSATLLREMREKRHRSRPEKSALALAPFFRGNTQMLHPRPEYWAMNGIRRDSLQALEASGAEVAFVSRLWQGTSIYGPFASLDTFRQLASQYRILHLSTHGKADDRAGDFAYLAFGVPGKSDDFEKLYARDLYNLELNADMVVLSACETGLGKFRVGEGIIGLTRGFAFAGAKSLVTSLWRVNDAETRDLLEGFHIHLKNGMQKDRALQQAKIDFMAQHRKNGGAYWHPYFWAGFITMGDMEPIR